MTEAASTHIRARLAKRAFLFDDPTGYMAGVDEALSATLHDVEGTDGGSGAPERVQRTEMARHDDGLRSAVGR